jgi:transposase-like protein
MLSILSINSSLALSSLWTTTQKTDTILGFQKETNLRVYTKEFKIESVRLYIANGKNKKKTAQELGTTGVTLNSWIVKYMNEVKDKTKAKPLKRNYEKELLEKDKQIARLEDEVLILKKSIGIFTRDRLQK